MGERLKTKENFTNTKIGKFRPLNQKYGLRIVQLTYLALKNIVAEQFVSFLAIFVKFSCNDFPSFTISPGKKNLDSFYV